MTTTDEALDYFRKLRAEFTPLGELQHTVTQAIWHAAERSVGAVSFGLCGNECCSAPGDHFSTPSFDAEAYKAQRTDARFQRELHISAVWHAAQIGQDPRPWVANARKVGVTWQQIADTLGMNSKQAAHQRFGG